MFISAGSFETRHRRKARFSAPALKHLAGRNIPSVVLNMHSHGRPSNRVIHPLLATLCLMIFTAEPAFADSAAHIDINAPILNGSHQSFLQYITPLRQSALGCPCTCSAVDPKASPPCANAPTGCMEIRCIPRVDGFSCCDGVTIPGGLRDINSVSEQVQIIDDNAASAADEDPVLSQAFVDILGVCLIDLAFVNDQPVEEEDGSTSRKLNLDLTTSERQRLPPGERRRARALFRLLVNTKSIPTLRAILNRLERELRLPQQLSNRRAFDARVNRLAR